MINIDNGPDADLKPLLAFPELDSGFPKLSAAAADACLTRCLSRLQALPSNEACRTWVARLGQTVSVLLVSASGHSTQVLDTLSERLAHWTLDRFLDTDAVAAEVLVTLAQQSPLSLALAGRTIVQRLMQGLQQQQALPAWTAVLIGLLRQVSGNPKTASIVQATLALLPDWRSALSEEAFGQAMASQRREDLLLLVGHFSLLSLVGGADVKSRPLQQALLADAPPPTIAPDMQAVVNNGVAAQTVRLHWLLTPEGTRSIDSLLNKASVLFAAPACQRIRQDIVLCLARYAALEHVALQGTEATLLVCQLLHLVDTAPGGPSPEAWAPVWTAVRQLSCMAKPNPNLAWPNTDRSRTVSTLLCPSGLAGKVEELAWRLALLKQHGLAVSECLGQLVQQAPCSPNGHPLVARVLQASCASAPEHEQALLELCTAQGLPLHVGAERYTKHLLQRAHLLALDATRENDLVQLNTTAILQQVASALPTGILVLGLFSHLHVELRHPDLSVDCAQWVMAQAQASVQALPPRVPSDWVVSICSAFDDDMRVTLPPAQFQQWATWLRSL